MDLKSYNPATFGLCADVIGPPGSGKSHFGLTAIRYTLARGKRCALVIAPHEAASYAGEDVRDAECLVAVDERWNPEAGDAGRVAEAWRKVTAFVDAAEKRADVGLLLIDTANTVLGDTLWHMVMAKYAAFDPRDLGGNSRQPYVTFASHLEAFMNRLDLFRFRTKAHVVKLWHEDIREVEGLGVARKEEVKEGGSSKTVLRWDSGRLPELRGAMRQSVTKWADLAFHVEAVLSSNPFRCRLVVVPDTTRMAKSRLDIVRELQKKEVPNDFGYLVSAVEARYGKPLGTPAGAR